MAQASKQPQGLNMRYNKLISRRTRASHENTGTQCNELSGTGRTTAIALKALSMAIEDPCVQVELKDHSIDGRGPTIWDNRRLGRLVRLMAEELDLKYIEIIETECGASVVSNHMTKSAWDIE
jgi:hypothetical protein